MRDGAIGKVKALVAQITQNWGMKKNDSWRQDPKQSGGGMFIDTGSHLVASSLFVSGLKVRSVAAHTDNCGLDVDILAALSIRFDGGALGTLATVGQVKNHSEYFALHGTEGTLEIRHYNWKVEQFLLNGQQVEVPATLEGEHPCQAFIRWISRGEKYEPPLYAIEVARITEAAYASAKKAKHIVIKR
jgi:predicted dehydrogenase